MGRSWDRLVDSYVFLTISLPDGAAGYKGFQSAFRALKDQSKDQLTRKQPLCLSNLDDTCPAGKRRNFVHAPPRPDEGKRKRESAHSAEFGAKKDTGFRPVAEVTTNNPDQTGAGMQHRDIRALKSNLDSGVNLKHFIRGEQQSGFTHIDGFTWPPFLAALQPIAQRDMQLVAHRSTIGRSLGVKPGGIDLFHALSDEVSDAHSASTLPIAMGG